MTSCLVMAVGGHSRAASHRGGCYSQPGVNRRTVPSLTRFCFGLHPAHPLAHGDEGVVVLLQALVRLLVQASEGSELRPVELLQLGVEDDSEGGDHAVEVGLLATSPPERRHTGTLNIFSTALSSDLMIRS